MITNIKQIKISQSEFELFKNYVYDNIGIALSDQKITLLRTRLNKRLNLLGFDTFTQYYNCLLTNEVERHKFISAISTNVTYFFREQNHWDFLLNNINKIFTNNKIRIWSSACSTGEEPYSIAMFLHQYLENYNHFDIKILATDISKTAIQTAKDGLYSKEQVMDLKKHHIDTHFTKIDNKYKIDTKIQELIMFRIFNLVYGDYNLFKTTKLDVIFCRNVLIYFDEDTKNKVANNLAQQLKSGGYLFIGHSESLTNSKYLSYVAPSIYQRK